MEILSLERLGSFFVLAFLGRTVLVHSFYAGRFAEQPSAILDGRILRSSAFSDDCGT